MTFIVSAQPFTVQIKPYVPPRVKPVITVTGLAGLTIVVAAGLVAKAVQSPAPADADVVMVPGRHMLWSGPASGLAVTFTRTVSLHPLSDQYNV